MAFHPQDLQIRIIDISIELPHVHDEINNLQSEFLREGFRNAIFLALNDDAIPHAGEQAQRQLGQIHSPVQVVRLMITQDRRLAARIKAIGNPEETEAIRQIIFGIRLQLTPMNYQGMVVATQLGNTVRPTSIRILPARVDIGQDDLDRIVRHLQRLDQRWSDISAEDPVVQDAIDIMREWRTVKNLLRVAAQRYIERAPANRSNPPKIPRSMTEVGKDKVIDIESKFGSVLARLQQRGNKASGQTVAIWRMEDNYKEDKREYLKSIARIRVVQGGQSAGQSSTWGTARSDRSSSSLVPTAVTGAEPQRDKGKGRKTSTDLGRDRNQSRRKETLSSSASCHDLKCPEIVLDRGRVQGSSGEPLRRASQTRRTRPQSLPPRLLPSRGPMRGANNHQQFRQFRPES